VEELREVWTQQWRRSGRRRSVVPTAVPGHGGEGQANGAVLERFDMEEERGDSVEAHAEDAEEGVPWRRTWRRSGRRWICDGEMIGLGFRGSNTLKKKISSDRYDDIINARCYSSYARHYKFLKNRV
jgi:hypothetical protein